VKSQSRPRCAWGLRQDRRDVHLRRHHALVAGYGRSADWVLADRVALDISCVDTGRYPDPGSRGCRMTQCR
jgi:hypothetical protein